MKLVSGNPFWPDADPPLGAYPPLESDLDTEVLIVGGGITGALVSLAFHDAGVPIAVISDERLGRGSTSASTALLQYEIDEHLTDLSKRIGRGRAEEAYRLCGEAIGRIAEINERFPADFAYRPSIYLAANKEDVSALQRECEARARAGFDVQWLDSGALEADWGFVANGAIVSRLGGEVDPYQLAQRIFAHLKKAGVDIYAETAVDTQVRDGCQLRTREGLRLRARRAVFAGGYRSQSYLAERVVRLKSTYAFVTAALPSAQVWPQRALWWDSASPYVYARMTADGRAMVGGGDLPIRSAALRRLFHARQTRTVARKAQAYCPRTNWQAQQHWNGIFGETADGLAYIGAPSDWKNADFALGFGGNGITYSQLAADCLVRQYRGEEVPQLSLFRFGRG